MYIARNPAASAATMLTNDSYFMGNLYYLLIYSAKCVYIMKTANWLEFG